MKAEKPTPKQMKKIRTWVRAAVQLLFFLFVPSVFTAAFNGVKYVFTQLGAGEQLEMTSFTAVLIAVCLYTVVFGRFFCGYACAFGALGDAVRAAYTAVCRKRKKKPVTIPAGAAAWLSHVKYLVLVVIVLMCFAGVYDLAHGTSPWDVFSMLHAFHFSLGGYLPGLVILIAILVGMCVRERFFCRFLCPMGAVFSLLPVLPYFSLHRDRDQCIRGCSACTRSCPSDIGLPRTGSLEVSEDCFQCGKCIGTCPKKNIHCGIRRMRGNEIWFTLIRAGIFLGLCIWLGV